MRQVVGGRPVAVPAGLPAVGGTGDPFAAAARVDEGEQLERDIAAEASRLAAERLTQSRRAEAAEQRKLAEFHQREADAMNAVERARAHDGRAVFSAHDAQTRTQIATLLHSLVGIAPPALDRVFGAPPDSRAVSAAVDHAIRGEAAAAEPEAGDKEDKGDGDAGGQP